MAEIYFDPDLPVVILDVTLEGIDSRKRISSVLDTGATFTMISWGIAEILGCNPAYSKEKMKIITASGVEHVPVVTLESVTCLGMTVDHVEAIVHNLPPESYVDGLLGLNFLRNFRFCLDFRKMCSVLSKEIEKSKFENLD